MLDVCSPQLQLHSPAVQKDRGGFVVDTYTKTEKERRQKELLCKQMHGDGQQQLRLQPWCSRA